MLFDRKRPFCVFEPLLRGLEATYAVHLRLIGKPVVDFLLDIIELFRLVLRLRGYERISILRSAFLKVKISKFAKFQVEGFAPHQPFFLSENYMNGTFIRYKNLTDYFVLSQCMHMRLTDRRTDRNATAIPSICIRSRKVKYIALLCGK